MDANKTHGEKARWKLQKNAPSRFEQILEATPHKIALMAYNISSHKTFGVGEERTNS